MRRYIIGFAVSLILTLLAAGVIVLHEASYHQSFSHESMRAAVILLALVQFIVQLIYFLHLGPESWSLAKNAPPDNRWKLAVFVSTIFIVLIVVIGSLWIMNHLSYNMMPGMEGYILHDEGMPSMR